MEILPFTGYYITMLIISIILDLIFPFLQIYWHFAFSIKQIIQNFEVWRIFTNFLVKPTRHFNVGIIFDIIYLYSDIYKLEQEAKYSNRYGKFLLKIFILCVLNVLLTFILYYSMGIKESRSLIKEVIYSFMSISSYKYPSNKTIVFYFPVRNKYVPLAVIFLNATTNSTGDLNVFKSPIVGFISGYIFCFLFEKMSFNFIPNILKKLFKKQPDGERKILRSNEPGEKKIFMNINPNDSTNVAYRKKESVIEGNEFNEFKKSDIKWE